MSSVQLSQPMKRPSMLDQARAWRSRGARVGVPSVLLLVLALGVALAIARPRFLSLSNLSALSYTVTATALIAYGQMMVVGIGAMDLSLGGIGGLVGVITGWSLMVLHAPVAVATGIGLGVGLACGALNGVLVVRFGFGSATAFVVTLASGTFFAGVTLGMTKAIPYYNLPSGFGTLAGAMAGGIPGMFVAMLLISVLLALVFTRSGMGTHALAVGGGAESARLCGIRVNRVVIATFAMAGLLSALAAVFYTAQSGAAQPTLGADWLLPSFAAPILGGTSLAGGRVSVLGTLLGAVFLAEVTDALLFLDISAFWNTFVQGAAILFAVGLDALRSATYAAVLVKLRSAGRVPGLGA